MLAIIVMRMQVDSPDQRLDPVAHLRLEHAFTSDEEVSLLVSGMSNLANHLLARLEQTTGATTREILDDVVRAVAVEPLPRTPGKQPLSNQDPPRPPIGNASPHLRHRGTSTMADARSTPAGLPYP